MEERIKLLNEFWSKQEDVEILVPFTVKNNTFWGEIKLISPPKEDLLFDVKVPFSYPFSNDTMSIRFCCKNVKGFTHMNGDNSICIIVPKKLDFVERLEEEVKLLKEWRDKYYIQEIEDEKYEYPILQEMHSDTFLFNDVKEKFSNSEVGRFNAYRYCNNANILQGESSEIFFVQNFEKKRCDWSETINKQLSTTEGLYFFVKKEPMEYGRIAALNWLSLNELIGEKGKKLLHTIKTNSIRNKNEYLYILIGYSIPKSEEVHWLAFKIEISKIPVRSKRVGPRYYEYEFYDREIEWCKTHNASYDRFFGRGALNNSLAEKKILVIGIGAVGSMLTKILTKAGAKNIGLCDPQTIEPGNLCRSEFALNNISVPKFIAMAQTLYGLSPYVNLLFEPVFDKCLLEPNKKATKAILEKYDLIFDCTSDMELAIVLDELELNCEILNLSISNKANEMVCVAKSKSISKEKNQLFSKLSVREDKMIYEGLGCWSSTFEASYFDIGCLLNLAVKNINRQFEKKGKYNSFVVNAESEYSSVKLNTIDY